MLKLGPMLAIITLGSRGAVLAEKDHGTSRVHYIEAPKVEAIDTTVRFFG